MTALTEDPLVESLLLLHDLHPLDVDARIQRALDKVRPYLGSHAGGVQYLGVRDGVARLRLEGSCNGCPSSTVTVQLAIEGAVQDAAPEVTEVRGRGDDRSAGRATLLQIGPAPGRDSQSRGAAGRGRALASAGSPCRTSGRRARGRSPRPPAVSLCCCARSAAPCTPTATPAPRAVRRWATGPSTARC